jgi:DNA repair exonuclease SbcCD ATPase subunit
MAELCPLCGEQCSHAAVIEKLIKERDEARKNYQWMVERAADNRLDGYRELGARAAAAENERDEARQLVHDAHAVLAEALRDVRARDKALDALTTVANEYQSTIDGVWKILDLPVRGLVTLEEIITKEREDLRAFRPLKDASPEDIRADGWTVAVHNDYRFNDEPHTFWLFTKNGRAIKGEGRSDAEALLHVRKQLKDKERG